MAEPGKAERQEDARNGRERVIERWPDQIVFSLVRRARSNPTAVQAVSFSLKNSFGILRYGSRPTDEHGKAQLIIRERLYGQYPMQVAYQGEDAHAPSRAEILVDFGSRPAPALPAEGILISPYPTAAMGLPFLVFYGIMWVVFAYAFGYLVLWRMRRAARTGTQPPAIKDL